MYFTLTDRVLWDTIHVSKLDVGNSNTDLLITKTIDLLREKSWFEIVDFEIALLRKVVELRTELTVFLLRLLYFEANEDNFRYLSTWIILQGEEYFKSFIQNSDFFANNFHNLGEFTNLNGEQLLNASDQAYSLARGIPDELREKFIMPGDIGGILVPEYYENPRFRESNDAELKRLFPNAWKLCNRK